MADLDDDYANSAHISGGSDYPLRWAADSEAFRRRYRMQRLRYGPGTRNWVDLTLPEGPAKGLAVIVHGGYWLALSPDSFCHLAAGARAAGWAVALPCYTLAPKARITAITAEIGAAVAYLAGQVAGPIRLAGHSAGGHLVARMACLDAPLPRAVAARLTRVVPISPLSDLVPLMRTSMNATLQLDQAEAVAESPAFLQKAAGVSCHVWVGGAERPAFLGQARCLSEAWGCPLTIEPGRHHFDVIEGLTQQSPLLDAFIA
ncbi:alpha/beta hydrolase [Phaeovulum sp.]|uniref:alpha/beta hydrolase n=1 Tax=Phaeovulum sp. TaxID=2934796 RepID=UPI0039E54EE8